MRLLVFFTLLVLANSAVADDWPHWMGPQQDNVWRESGIMNRFPASGLKAAWRTPVAGGYSGPAVAEGRVVVTDYVTKDNVKVGNFERNEFTGLERIQCLEQASGKVLWKYEYPVKYSISYPSGPRCTPVIHEGRVFALGAEGNLNCLDLTNGEVLWAHDLKDEYGTKSALWGYASHPLLDGDRLICLAGGEGSHCVAFDTGTGKELWRTGTATEQGYSPPVIIEAAGVRQLILTGANIVYAVNPENGKPYWSIPYEASNGSIIMTPIKGGEFLFVAGYSNKNLLLKLNQDTPGAEEVWRDLRKGALSPVNVQPFLHEGTLYGCDQNGAMMGIEFKTGERLWETAWPLAEDRPIQSGTSFIVRQADRYWLFTEQGDLIIAKLTPKGYEELDRQKVIDATNVAFGRDVVWAAPAFANRHIYLRNDKEIICIDLSAQ
jgi:outer membrane protein assembly factor BamB